MNQPFNQPGTKPYFGEIPPQAQTMQSQDIMMDLLTDAKALSDGYCVQTQEASCPQLRRIMMENWNQTMNDQYAIFEAMRTRGWYEVKEAPAQEIQQAVQTFAQQKSKMQQN